MSPSNANATPKLFTPVTLGGKQDPVTLQHRIVMAPLTRLRAGDSGVQPAIAVTYYSQRATPGGLQITEATNISPTARGYFGAPGIFNQQQIDAWRNVTDAVHAKGGVIFLQLWHTGRLGHPLLQPEGQLPVSSSTNMPYDEHRTVPTIQGRKPMVTPRKLDTRELAGICEDYRQAAVNAMAAGFDGVEIHAANGYLIEQFIYDGINDRTDQYGGSVENRARFLFEVLDAVLTSVPSSRVGVRLSPFGRSCGQRESDPVGTYSYIFDKLNTYDLAYAHLIEPRGYHYENDKTPVGGATKFFRQIYKGILLSVSGYERANAIETVAHGDADLIAIGRFFISNPDLVKRLRKNAKLTPFDRDTFYLDGEKGYTDYPFLEEMDGAV